MRIFTCFDTAWNDFHHGNLVHSVRSSDEWNYEFVQRSDYFTLLLCLKNYLGLSSLELRHLMTDRTSVILWFYGEYRS